MGSPARRPSFPVWHVTSLAVTALFLHGASVSAVVDAFPPSSTLPSASTAPRSSAVARLRPGTVPRRGSRARFPRGGGGGGGPPPPPALSAAAPAAFVDAPLWQSVAVVCGANALGAVISLFTKTQFHVDLLGTGAFAAAAVPPLLGGAALTARVKASCAAVIVWGAKLASFLFYRAVKKGEDARLEDTLSTVSGTLGFWTISALWGLVCSLPHSLGTTSSAPGNSLALYVGSAMYAVGLIVETLADYQKWTFKASNPGRFCDAGLWSWSQHPNWFGNLLLWMGIFVMNAPALIDPAPEGGTLLDVVWGWRRVVMAALGPLFMWSLFQSQARGDLTPIVDLAEAKYGGDPKYREYLETVPLVVPNFFR